MKSWYNLARAFGERVCRTVVSGGYEAAYATSGHVKGDLDARSFRAACFAFLHRKTPRVIKAANTAKTVRVNKPVISLSWLANLIGDAKRVSLSVAQKAAKGNIKVAMVVVSYTRSALEFIASKKKAFWAAINGFNHFGYKADMQFRQTRGVIANIANTIMSAKDVVAAGIDAAYSWLVSNQ